MSAGWEPQGIIGAEPLGIEGRGRLCLPESLRRTVASGNENALSIAESFFECVIVDRFRTYLEDLTAFDELP